MQITLNPVSKSVYTITAQRKTVGRVQMSASGTWRASATVDGLTAAVVDGLTAQRNAQNARVVASDEYKAARDANREFVNMMRDLISSSRRA
jgi:hypothetical protein